MRLTYCLLNPPSLAFQHQYSSRTTCPSCSSTGFSRTSWPSARTPSCCWPLPKELQQRPSTSPTASGRRLARPRGIRTLMHTRRHIIIRTLNHQSIHVLSLTGSRIMKRHQHQLPWQVARTPSTTHIREAASLVGVTLLPLRAEFTPTAPRQRQIRGLDRTGQAGAL